ncbi:MAG: 2Fe-2S iron-sulfur cluster-binding protein [Thermodesulfobacteriota bacterium]
MNVIISIDGQPYEVEKGKSLLSVLKSMGIRIPSLCHHPALHPSGVCKLCAVEVSEKGKPAGIRLSCTTLSRNDLSVITRSPQITAARSKAIQTLLQMAPQSDVLLKLADEYDLETGAKPDGCIRCRLCINVCKEIVGANALEMVKKNGRNFVVPIEGRCIGGATCANICPTGVIKVEDRDNVRTISIRGEIIGRHPLERCEGCGRYFETPGFLKHMDDRMIPHPVLKTHHRYCPACAKLYSDRILSFRTLK